MTRFHKPFILAVLTGALSFLMLPAWLVSQPKRATTEELSQTAEVVAHGRVREMKSEWDETKSRIRTRVTLSVDEYIKGGGGSSMDIFVPGGEVGGVGEIYSHMPKFSQDEDVVVFAEKDKKGRYRVAGGSDGKYGVKKDEVTGKPVVAGGKKLDDFKAEIKNAAKGPKK